MNILYYTWNENSQIDMVEALKNMGHQVVFCSVSFQNYEEDEEFTQQVEKIFKEEECDILLSFNFFPLLAKLAEKIKKKYLSWIYDMPHYTLCSPSIKGEYVYSYLFDKIQCQKIKELGARHVFHMPLAVNTERLNRQLGMPEERIKYEQDVSFVGSLYENNMFQKINYLPDYVRGYLEGIIKAQRMIYGYDLIEEVLGTDMIKVLRQSVQLNLDKTYFWNEKEIYVDMLHAEVTHQERVELLKRVSDLFDFKLYTASEAKGFRKEVQGGIVSYERQMPEIFRKSKINLNITLRSIASGIPLRAMDIMGAGGFLLSNYQPELAEYFIDGEEMVLFESREDMLFKIAYYLEHEEERKRIAVNGWKKVQKLYAYEIQLEKMFDLSGGIDAGYECIL